MKKIFLIGDSIRSGYDTYVKESMEGLAEVFWPDENCRFAQYTLRCVHMWKDDLGLDNVDAVHWNVGLWDTLRIYGDEILTSPEVYADYIERIEKRLEFIFPGAKIIFATSTPCIEEGFIKEFEWRSNEDIEKYNKIATDVLTPMGVRINDLYSLLKDAPESYHSDQTHYYTPEATELIGTAVNKILCEEMGIDYSNLKKPNKADFAIKKNLNDKHLYIKKGNLYERVHGI
ncbi:MAG: SGNH/GDSL hydrolase family protein [Clostridia bacterium]|nr:SGNH/GDSL hydrolase family protein [Clostridia bacterium]